MALLEYRARDTLLHRLHPISKAVWLLSMGLVLSIYFDPFPLAAILALSLPFFILGRIPWSRWLKPLGFVLLLGMFGYFVVSLFLNRPGVFTRYPDLVGIKLLHIAGEGFFLGPMAVTVGGLMYTAGQTLRSITMVFMVAVFVYSTPPSDLVYLLSKARLPHKLVFIVMVAYRFFPHIFRKLAVVTAAQKLRGWRVSLRNPLRLPQQYLPVTIPIVTEVARLAEHTTMAVESRAYGSGRFSLHRRLQWRLADTLFTALWLLIGLACLYLYVRHGVGPL